MGLPLRGDKRMSKIDDKHRSLKRQGLDLGQALGPEQDAGFGGRMRRYQHGYIYYHSVMGSEAREVHGGILDAYLAQGGHAAHPQSGQRRFGFPLADERDAPGNARVSQFEWGAIYWVPGRGGVPLYGRLYQEFQRARVHLGLPLAEPASVAGGEAAYFQRGCLWTTTSVPNSTLVRTLNVPLLGNPRILNPRETDSSRFPGLAVWPEVSRETYETLTAWRPSVFAEIWRGRLALRPVLAPNRARPLLPMADTGVRKFNESPVSSSVGVMLEIQAGTPQQLTDGTLYDLVVRLPGNQTAVAAPHAYYAAAEWKNFGILHITDLHISLRNERFRDQLLALGRPAAAAGYANFQDSLRAFNTYANRLHAKGLADVVLATGDLVDYVFEEGQGTGGNFFFLETLLRGGAGAEELRIPIFTVFGNHDYRVNPYALRAEVDAVRGPFDDKIKIDEYPSHNLTPDEAAALQGGKVLTVDAQGAVDMLAVDPNGQAGAYNYYRNYINREQNYTVRLGPHRVVMMDTGSDLGVPSSANLGELLSLFWKNLWGTFTEDEQQAQAGAPNLGGTGGALDDVRQALSNVPPEGLVIVGMHAPAFSPPGGEYPFYLRETQHPVADPAQVPQLLVRRKVISKSDADKGLLTGWVPSGTPFFKIGPVDENLDFGIARGRADEFVRIAAGEGFSRPVDVILCGHQHDRVEFRFRLDRASKLLQFFTDFYTENPENYYATINNRRTGGIEAGQPIQIRIKSGAPANGHPQVVRDNRGGVTKVTATLEVPPYSDPLNSTNSAARWWQTHRPLLLQTGALGPIDPRQRFDPRWKLTAKVGNSTMTVTIETANPPKKSAVVTNVEPLPPVSPNAMFRGFRLLQVRENVITRIRYVTLAELRSRNFTMPWEEEFTNPIRRGLTNPPVNPILSG